MSDLHEDAEFEDPTERVKVVGGRVAGPFVKVPLWVMLNSSVKARALYEVLAAHRDWWDTGVLIEDITQEDLARLIDAKQGRTVRTYIRELEKLGALDVVRQKTTGGLNATNVYVIHELPPDGFTLPRTLKEYYAQRDETAGHPDGRSSAPRSDQGKHDGPTGRESGESGNFSVAPGRTDRRSSAPRRAPQRPLVGRSSAPLPYKEGDSKNPPPSPPSQQHHERDGRGGGEGKRNGDEQHGFPVPDPRPAADGSGADSGPAVPPDLLQAATELLRGLPEPIAPGHRVVADLAPVVAEALAAGWDAGPLAEFLAVKLPEHVHSVRRFLAHRLDELPAPRKGRPVRPHCGDPSCRNGHREDENGFPAGRCPSWPHSIDPSTANGERP